MPRRIPIVTVTSRYAVVTGARRSQIEPAVCPQSAGVWWKAALTGVLTQMGHAPFDPTTQVHAISPFLPEGVSRNSFDLAAG
jgi:hypothetical protein